MATVNYLEDFLLNSGPKQDCLVRICEYINVFDMVHLSDSSKHPELFVEFFVERVINFNSFDFMEVPSNRKAKLLKEVFEHFGPCMQKIKVSLSRVPFKNFMENVMEYCVPGNLTELEIEVDLIFSDKFQIVPDHAWLERARPISHRLEKFSLINNRNGHLDPIYELLRRDLPNLKSLTLRNFRFNRGWAHVFPNELPNLTELRLINVELHESVNEFVLFLNPIINLQVFVHHYQNNQNPQPEAIADCLYRRFPQLKGFGCNIHDGNQNSAVIIGNRFSFLEKFTNLTEIHVASCNHILKDIHNIFQFIPNVKIFLITEMNLSQPPVAVRRIRQSIKRVIDRRCDRFPRNDRVHIFVKEHLYREFMALKNINEIIELTVLPNYY